MSTPSRTIRPIKFIGPQEFEPVRAYAGDAGFDLFCSEDVAIPIGGFRDVPCGICIELPSAIWAMITGRSSTIRRRRILVTQGILDNGYRGPLFAGAQNLGEDVVQIERGERLAQLIPFVTWADGLEFEHVGELSPSDRGDSGFGSTGN